MVNSTTGAVDGQGFRAAARPWWTTRWPKSLGGGTFATPISGKTSRLGRAAI